MAIATGGPGTTRELALRTQVGFSATMWTLRNMVTAGEAEKVSTVRVPGVKRPVPVYGLASQSPCAEPGADLQAILRAWL